MKRRILLWLRAFTDKHLVREQLKISVRHRNGKLAWSAYSMDLALYAKTSHTGVHIIEPSPGIMIEFEIVPVVQL